MKRAWLGGVALAAACAGTPPAPPAEPVAPPPAAAAPAADPTKRELKILTRVMPAVETGGIAGCVVVQFIIHPDGRVGEIAVVDAKPGTRYVPATLTALKQWRFEAFDGPALKGQQTFNFDPELVRLPDDAVRSPFAVATKEGALKNEPCRTGAPG